MNNITITKFNIYMNWMNKPYNNLKTQKIRCMKMILLNFYFQKKRINQKN